MKYQWEITFRWNDGDPDWYFKYKHKMLMIGLYWLRINAQRWVKRV